MLDTHQDDQFLFKLSEQFSRVETLDPLWPQTLENDGTPETKPEVSEGLFNG